MCSPETFFNTSNTSNTVNHTLKQEIIHINTLTHKHNRHKLLWHTDTLDLNSHILYFNSTHYILILHIQYTWTLSLKSTHTLYSTVKFSYKTKKCFRKPHPWMETSKVSAISMICNLALSNPVKWRSGNFQMRTYLKSVWNLKVQVRSKGFWDTIKMSLVLPTAFVTVHSTHFDILY